MGDHVYVLWQAVGAIAPVPVFLLVLGHWVVTGRRKRREHELHLVREEYRKALEARDRFLQVQERMEAADRLRLAAAQALSMLSAADLSHLPVDEDGCVLGITLGDPHFLPGHTCVSGYCPHYPQRRPATVIEITAPQPETYEPGFKGRGLLVRHRSGV